MDLLLKILIVVVPLMVVYWVGYRIGRHDERQMWLHGFKDVMQDVDADIRRQKESSLN